MMYCWGINFQAASVELREALALNLEQRQQCLRGLRVAGVREAVMLVTCNRTEIYAVGDDASIAAAVDAVVTQYCNAAAHDLQSLSYRMWERDVVHHVFRVVASLDSMVVGEPQILGQAKASFEEAQAIDMVASTLHQLFARAFQVGKKVREDTAIAERPVSVSSVAINLAAQVCGRIDRAEVALLGMGDMGVAALKQVQQLGARGIHVLNRNLERAQQLAAEYQVAAHPWEELANILPQVDIVVCSTASEHAIVSSEMLRAVQVARREQPLFVIDLGVPRNVEASVAEIPGVYLYNVDDLQQVAQANVEARRGELDAAERIVHEATQQCWQRFVQGSAHDTIASLHRKCEQIRQAEVAKSLAKAAQNGGMTDAVLESCTRSIVAKILHDPVVQMKPELSRASVSEVDEHAGTWLRRLFRLDS